MSKFLDDLEHEADRPKKTDTVAEVGTNRVTDTLKKVDTRGTNTVAKVDTQVNMN